MRTAFIQELCAFAEKDDRIWLICGDLGYSVLEAFADRFPKRYLNAGVAEQNMTGIAAGLAMTGKTVFTYSIANFPVMRCLEQIRNDVCYHNLNVKVVSVGGGLAYGSQGYTHHGVEDLAVMSVMPNITVIAPADPTEVRAATRALVATHGPAYLRLGKAGEPILHKSDIHFEIGRAIQVQDGTDLTLASTGGMLGTTIEAANRLRADGLSVRVLSMPTLVPFDAAAIAKACRDTGGIITVEEHGAGGLGTQVAEVLAAVSAGTRFIPIRLSGIPLRTAGSQVQLRTREGLSVEGILSTADRLLHDLTKSS
jgi:transketolase